jgi:signal peptidase I
MTAAVAALVALTALFTFVPVTVRVMTASMSPTTGT